jgi:protein arginine kinase activator
MFGRTQHRGKYPKRLMAYKTLLIDIEELKRKLDRAVKKEDYEEAALLRDQIKELESRTSGGLNE